MLILCSDNSFAKLFYSVLKTTKGPVKSIGGGAGHVICQNEGVSHLFISSNISHRSSSPPLVPFVQSLNLKDLTDSEVFTLSLEGHMRLLKCSHPLYYLVLS